MRVLFLALLLVNLTAAAYLQFGARSSAEGQPLSQQIKPQQIRVVPPAPRAAAPQPDPTPTPASVSACIEWGAFSGVEAERAAMVLEELKLGTRLSRRGREETTSYWVYIPPLKTRQDVNRKIGELTDLGITEYFPVQDPERWRNAISLGIFRTEEAARKFLSSLAAKGIRSAVVGERSQKVTAVTYVVKDPDVALTGRLAEIQAAFQGSELKAVTCE